MTGEWWPAILAFVGAAVGSGASFYAARRDTQAQAEAAARDLSQRQEASSREEWGRRFTAALADLNSDESFRRRQFGRIVLEAMVKSDLTSDEDHRLLQDVLLAHARLDQDGDEGGLGTEGMVMDGVRVVEDDGDEAARGPTVTERVVKVTRDQIESARLLIRLRGGEDRVDPDIVLIANAQRRARPSRAEPMTP